MWFDIFLQMANHMRDSNSEPNAKTWLIFVVAVISLTLNLINKIIILYSKVNVK